MIEKQNISLNLDEWVEIQVALNERKHTLKSLLSLESLTPDERAGINKSIALLKTLSKRFDKEWAHPVTE